MLVDLSSTRASPVISPAAEILKGWRLDELPVFALIPRTASVDLAVFPVTRRIVEELVDQARSRGNLPD